MFFLVHFVGDVHQPLHLGRASDRGGNDIEVTFNHKKTNLHSLWDTGLLVHTGLSRDEYLAGLNRMVKPAAKAEWLDSLDPVDWATESHVLAHSYAYVVPKNGKVSDAYYRRNIIVVDERLAAAGIRLAAVLNNIYDPQVPLFASVPEDVKEIVFAMGIPHMNKPTVKYRYLELCRAIDDLHEDQYFTVIFYQKDRQLEPPPPGLSRRPATDNNKSRVKAWLDPENGNIKPLTKPDPMQTLRQALRYKPDVIHLWTDKMSDLDVPELLGEIDRLNESNAIINTIQWSMVPKEASRREPGTPELIAEHTGGQHRFYGNDDVVGR